jgi:hypothetical protein
MILKKLILANKEIAETKMKKPFYVICEHCKRQIPITSPNQIGQNIGRDRILCEQCYEFENGESNF